MSDKNLQEELKNAAVLLVEGIRKGKWEGKFNPNLPIPQSTIPINVIEHRCPGYKKTEYEEAFAFGLFVTR